MDKIQPLDRKKNMSYWLQNVEDHDHDQNEVKGEPNLPSVPQPETPLEPMEFLSRSWSLSVNEISRALAKTQMPPTLKNPCVIPEPVMTQHLPNKIPIPFNSRKTGAIGRLFNHKESNNSSILKKKEKARMENAHMHTVLSVAGLAAALAAVTATENCGSKMSRAMASATELLASYCIELAESAGAGHDHVASTVRSAVDIRRASDLVTLTAAAATALRGEAALKARLPTEAKRSAAVSPYRKDIINAHSTATFVNRIEEEDTPCVGDLLQHSSKGVLRWKNVSVYINKKCQVIIKLKSKHVGGAFSKKNKWNSFLVPGATVATILMLGALHARHIYEDKKIEEAREKGVELEFHPDVKASFLRLLPLRSISRLWGSLTSVELPIWLRPYMYKAWARAFHSNLEEVGLPLEEYASLREFFVHTLKEGSRTIDSDPYCLVSPVDGIVLRFGELGGAGAMIEQVKGFSYSASSLLGASSFLPMITAEYAREENGEEENTLRDETKRSWWRISLASPKVREMASPMKGLFYCVIYLKPGDYHRVHSPVDWNVLVRRHFTGHLFPMNERAARTIRNLYIENERVVLEGQWREGFIALAAIGATNIGSIELYMEPTLRTNQPRKKLLHPLPPDERVYEPEGIGIMLKKGDEIAGFNMGSTVVLVFQAPISKASSEKGNSSEFKFCVKRGERIRMGEALGKWHE